MRGERQAKLCRLLLVLTLCFIWGNSLLPASASQALSDGTGNLMGFLLNWKDFVLVAGTLLRKLAHFTEFAALGLLLRWLAELKGRSCRFVLLWGAAAAIADECIQFFVPGRAPGIGDVAIDVSGVAAGMILLQTGYCIARRKQPNQIGGTKQ